MYMICFTLKLIKSLRKDVSYSYNVTSNLLLFLSIVTTDLEVSQLIGVLVGGNDVQEITKLLLLQVLLGEVLQVSLRERKFSSNVNLGLLAGDLDLGTKVTSLAVDLDAIMKELLEGGSIENLILNRITTINSELGNSLLGRLLGNLLRKRYKK